MERTVKKMVKTGYGLGLLSLAQARKAAAVLKRDLDLNEEESLKLARELVRNSEKAGREVVGTVGKYTEEALLKSKVVTRAELSLLKKAVKRKMSSLRRQEESSWSKIKRKVLRK